MKLILLFFSFFLGSSLGASAGGLVEIELVTGIPPIALGGQDANFESFSPFSYSISGRNIQLGHDQFESTRDKIIKNADNICRELDPNLNLRSFEVQRPNPEDIEKYQDIMIQLEKYRESCKYNYSRDLKVLMGAALVGACTSGLIYLRDGPAVAIPLIVLLKIIHVSWKNNREADANGLIQLESDLKNPMVFTSLKCFGDEDYILTELQREPLELDTNSLVVQDNTCGICLEEIKNGDMVVKGNCQHVYHRNCARPWFTNQKKCPMCRAVWKDDLFLNYSRAIVEAK